VGSIKLRVETIGYFLRRHYEEKCRRREVAYLKVYHHGGYRPIDDEPRL